ncbi:hypothetical protein PAXRUDRAFT_157780 [Paxillus rubicundulus Ve08.2h10]|uniref:Uncharacterized protein n=1 Tax=Paxillus rubicundulus Ve08.2h10 TaxID=930991 RepID=A0A0D0CDG7_9AGAM|nr:hypothetical protein PAXRUDRAFT_157780 [Paxillus rubicundulus Ve08.2h10]
MCYPKILFCQWCDSEVAQYQWLCNNLLVNKCLRLGFPSSTPYQQSLQNRSLPWYALVPHCQANTIHQHAQGGGACYPYPQHVWSPAGGWRTQPSNWASNTTITMIGILAIAYGVWNVSAEREVTGLYHFYDIWRR